MPRRPRIHLPGLPLHIVYVNPGDAQAPLARSFISAALALAQRGGVHAQGEVRSGKPFTEILAAAAACQADLLVIGSRGDSRIGRALVGGVAQKVLGLSEHPVLVQHFQSSQGIPTP